MVSYDGNETIQIDQPKFEDLQQPIFRSGKLVYNAPKLTKVREHSLSQQELFKGIKANEYPLGLESSLYQRKQRQM